MIEKKNFYINGQWIEPKNQKDLVVVDPSSEETCAVISLGDKEDVHLAVAAAKKALIASRTNTLLSLPMLLSMVAAQNLY